MQTAGTTALALARRIVAAALLTASALLLACVASAAAAPAVVGQWRFDEGVGQTAQDDGRFGLHGVLGSSTQADGADPLRIGGATGGALQFAEGTYVRVADARRLDLPALTVEAVARAGGSPGQYRYLVAHGARGCFAGSYGLYTAKDGGLAFYVFDGERYFVSPSARPADVWDGAWHRVAGSFDGDTLRVFVDGREVASGLRVAGGTAIEYASMPEGTYFGSYLGACRLPFGGDLDAVRIWSGEELPPAVVAGPAPGTTPARLDESSPGTVLHAAPPKAACAVRASRKRIIAKRRASVTLRAAGTRGPLGRVRLSVRRAGTRKVLASPRTNAKGRAKVSLTIARSGRLRVAVVGLPACSPAFISVARAGR